MSHHFRDDYRIKEKTKEAAKEGVRYRSGMEIVIYHDTCLLLSCQIDDAYLICGRAIRPHLTLSNNAKI